MSIIYPIPHKAHFQPTGNIFSAPFTGIYDFNIPANQNQTLIKLNPNTVFLLDNFSFAGNISKEDFLSALDLSNLPTVTIRKKSDSSVVYDKPIVLTQFYEDKTASAFLQSQAANDEALITFSAKLNQIAPLIGIDPLLLSLSFNIFYIDSNDYNAAFADSIDKEFSGKLKR